MRGSSQGAWRRRKLANLAATCSVNNTCNMSVGSTCPATFSTFTIEAVALDQETLSSFGHCAGMRCPSATAFPIRDRCLRTLRLPRLKLASSFRWRSFADEEDLRVG
jgi:hypothetical protein